MQTNGPNYDVPTGRRDGLVSNARDADDLPEVGDSLDQLKTKFILKGLSEKDLVVLSGNASYIYIYIYSLLRNKKNIAACK